MLRMGLFLAAVLIPVQIFFGHLVGDYVHEYQPAKFAAIEGRWHDEQPAGEVLIAIPDEATETNKYEIKIPILGSLIGSMSFTSKEIGLTDFPPQDRPPVLIPFFAFRIMVGCGLVMLILAWARLRTSALRIASSEAVCCSGLIFLSFPLPFIAILTGWYTAEVGRQPWVVYGVLRTADAMTPFLTTRAATISLVVFGAIYTLIFAFGILYIYRLLRAGPVKPTTLPSFAAVPNRPMSLADQDLIPHGRYVGRGRIAMIMFWVALLSVSILLYVLLDGFDLGVGMLFGLTRSETERQRMMAAVAPIWDGNETWLVVTAVILWGAFPTAYSTLLSAFYLPLLVMLAGLILRGVAFEYRHKTHRMQLDLGLEFHWRIVCGFVYPGSDGRRAGRRACRLSTDNMSAATSAGSAPSRHSAVSGCVLATRFSAPAGWSRNAKTTSARLGLSLLPYLAVGLLVFLVVVFVYALAENLRVMDRWLERPYLFVFPVIGALSALCLRSAFATAAMNCPFLWSS